MVVQQPSPERRQVRCGCTWNCQSAPAGGCSRLHRGGWCDANSRTKAEVAWRHSRSATHVRQSRIRRSQGMQLPRSSDQACSTSSARVSSSDVSMQSDQQSARLLQLAAVRSSSVDHQQTSKNAEQCSSCGIGSKASLRCQAAPTPAPLAASTAAHSIQGGGTDA